MLTAPHAGEAVEVPACLGRYQILGVMGQGGFGVVYRGYDDQLRRDVAIKVPHRPHVTSQQDSFGYLGGYPGALIAISSGPSNITVSAGSAARIR